jgi:hypothetical protein
MHSHNCYFQNTAFTYTNMQQWFQGRHMIIFPVEHSVISFFVSALRKIFLSPSVKTVLYTDENKQLSHLINYSVWLTMSQNHSLSSVHFTDLYEFHVHLSTGNSVQTCLAILTNRSFGSPTQNLAEVFSFWCNLVHCNGNISYGYKLTFTYFLSHDKLWWNLKHDTSIISLLPCVRFVLRPTLFKGLNTLGMI